MCQDLNVCFLILTKPHTNQRQEFDQENKALWTHPPYGGPLLHEALGFSLDYPATSHPTHAHLFMNHGNSRQEWHPKYSSIWDIMYKGANTVKYTTPLPCIGLSESDSKLYTNFEFCEGKNHRHLKNTLIYKTKEFMLPICFSRKIYIF
jgi:hypothetical protein